MLDQNMEHYFFIRTEDDLNGEIVVYFGFYDYDCLPPELE